MFPVSSFQPRLGLPVRFGWDNSIENGPKAAQYNIKLNASHLNSPLNLENPEPSAALIRQLSGELQGLKNSRFAVLTGTRALLGTPERVRTFQENLMKSLYSELRASNGALFPAPKYELLCQLIKGFGPTTVMHWDFKEWPFLSISYEQLPVLKNSLPLLADSAQLFHDLKQSPVDKSTVDAIPEDSNKPDKILHHYNQQMKDRYLISLPVDAVADVPILIFNNNRWDGVLHGAMKPEGTNRFENDRTIYQIAMSDVAFPEHKYAKLRYDRHQKIPLSA